MNRFIDLGLKLFLLAFAALMEVIAHEAFFSMSGYHIRVDFLIVVVIYIGLANGGLAGVLAGLFAGLPQDFLFGDPVGLQMMVMCTVGFVAGWLHGRVYLDNTLYLMLLTAGLLIVKQGFLILLVELYGINSASTLLNLDLLFSLLASALMAPLFYYFLRFIDRLIPRQY